MRSLVVFVLCVCVTLGCFYYAYRLYAGQQVPKTIDLSKDDALQLMQAQYHLEQAYELRERLVSNMYHKYNIAQSAYKLDIATGRFILNEDKPK